MPNDAISREAAIAIVKEHYRAHRSSANVPGNIVGKFNGFAAIELLKLKDAIASLPADTRCLDPEETKAVLRQALSGCGPMSIVYAEAAINSMAGIESPRGPAEAQD